MLLMRRVILLFVKGLNGAVYYVMYAVFLALRDQMGGASKIVASVVNQDRINIDEVDRFWREDVGVDTVIKRKFLTWGVNTDLDDHHSADTTPYLDTEQVPCPFIFERLNIDTRGNVMVCGYDIAANTSMGNVGHDPLLRFGMVRVSFLPREASSKSWE